MNWVFFRFFSAIIFLSIIGVNNGRCQDRLPLHTVFLVGDAGEPSVINSPQLNLLQSEVSKAGEKSTVIFLGDNIYPKGMPEYDDKYRQEAEAIISAQLGAVKGIAGNVYVIPGNHDWKKGDNQGVVANAFQEEFVEVFMDSANVYLPDRGCPGPVEIPLSEELILIIIDSQWILHPWTKPRQPEGCMVNTTADVLDLLEDALRRNRNKKIIVASHHPMYSYGIHGGATTVKDNIFPLTEANKNLWIPLPIIGSIYPIYRKYFGSLQDVANPVYKNWRDHMVSILEEYPNTIHVAGHEHSLQYSYKDSVHYIVSGAGSKTTHVKHKGYAQFASATIGFTKIDFFQDGAVNVVFLAADGNPLFEKELMKIPYEPPPSISEFVSSLDLSDSLVNTFASDRYLIKPSKYWMIGENYRDVWAANIDVPFFDIGTQNGGLEILKRGGGMQTKSLRMEASDETQYVIRSIEKYADKVVPYQFRDTFAADLIQDQISSSNPFGAFTVPYLADAAGIYHTNPKLYFVPDDPRFGDYRYDFANTLVLFEERPAGNRKDVESFGKSKKIYSTADMLTQLYKDNDNYVDQDWVLKSRLFDLYIGDWDRHDDQWRWASFKKGKGRMFRPIPRDRDNAYFVAEGFLMSIVKKKWAMPKFQGFDYDLKNPAGFMFNARYFDRDFLSEMDAKAWMKEVDKLKGTMTDEVIESAINTWPKPVYDLTGEEIISKLKVRREKLDEFAMDYYYFLSRKVNVRGSNKKEYFRVERLDNDSTRVRVWKSTDKDKKDKKIYDRTFLRKETKEIRLYGLKGGDEFKIEGDVKKGIKLRVIGGPGKDEIRDESRVRGLSKKTIVYDKKKKTDLKLGGEARNKTSNDPAVNFYDRKDFKYNFLAPLVFLNYNVDDKIFLGAGFLATVHGFRKEPFKSQHFLLGTIAPATASFDFRYKGTYSDVIRKLDLKFNLLAQSPNYVSNFFGQGNDTEFNQNINDIKNVDSAIEYYRVRYKHYSTELMLSHQVGNVLNMNFGAHFQAFITQDDYENEDRFILDWADSTGNFSIFDWKYYAGLVVNMEIDTRNNKVIPDRGLLWNIDLRGYEGLNEESKEYTRFLTDFSFYLTTKLPTKLTLAARVGGGHNFGDSEYYQGQILSGPVHLRGFRKTRFNGDSKFFSNTELRWHMLRVRGNVVPMTIGLNAFYDIGRVRFNDLNSSTWHKGYGGGLWFAPYNALILAFEVGSSVEETRGYFRMGFLF